MYLYLRMFLSMLLGLLFITYVKARSSRMIGGDVAKKEASFPFVVAIRNSKDVFCTGSIISERYVITAAHCIVIFGGSFTQDNLQVVAGVQDLNLESSEYKVVINVEEMFVPVEYTNSSGNIGDIAILKLKEDLDLKNYSKLGKISLPKKTDSYVDAEATVIGFGWNELTKVIEYPSIPGLVSIEGKSDGKMRYARTKVLEHSNCVKSYVEGLQKKNISKKHICAQMNQRNSDKIEGVCSGDSGGPLIYENVLIGIVNSSPPACRENVQPSVYARVTEFIDFIEKVSSGKIDKTILSSTG